MMHSSIVFIILTSILLEIESIYIELITKILKIKIECINKIIMIIVFFSGLNKSCLMRKMASD
jgi:hypothetical protein